ncbi:S24 family peptidase [Pseudomonas fluorescens]
MISIKGVRDKLARVGRVLESALADGQDTNHAELVQISAWDDETPLDADEVYIPFLKEVELSAGTGRTAIEESSRAKLRFGKHSLKRHNVDPANAVCVPIKGNSMEPILKNGATVGVDRGNRTITDGDLYAINHSGQLRVKQLYRTPSGIRIRSFNREEFPDEEYTWDQIESQDLVIIGRVFWWAMFA